MDLLSIFKHTLMISYFVFVMMLLVDFLDMSSKGAVSLLFKGGRWRQYSLVSLLGSIPGCLGSFLNVSIYIRGLVSFGAIAGGMIATSGDEAFVMLVEFPKQALFLFLLLFICGMFFASIIDRLVPILKIQTGRVCKDAHCEECLPGEEQKELSFSFNIDSFLANFRDLSFTRFLILVIILSFLAFLATGNLGPTDWGWERFSFVILSLLTLFIVLICSEHYLESHIWQHIIKRHLFRVFLWAFGALVLVHWGLAYWDLSLFIKEHMMWVLLLSGLIGVIPESGPHLVFVMMYAQGVVPFSVLFTASFVQDGHGMLPLLSYNLKDAVFIKAFNLVFGLLVGGGLFFLDF